MKKRIKIQGTLIFLAVIITILLSKFIFPYWKHAPLDELLDVFGISLVLFGFLFRITARGYKEEKSDGGKNLVKDGPYALLRHPMYFGTLMIGTGIIFVLLQLWTLLLFLMVFLLIYIPQIKKEEDKLSKQFKEEYKNYCKVTPKYFPNIYYLGRVSLKRSWIRKEFFPFTIVIATVLVIETWEDVKSFGSVEFSKELSELALIILYFILIVILFMERDRAAKGNSK